MTPLQTLGVGPPPFLVWYVSLSLYPPSISPLKRRNYQVTAGCLQVPQGYVEALAFGFFHNLVCDASFLGGNLNERSAPQVFPFSSLTFSKRKSERSRCQGLSCLPFGFPTFAPSSRKNFPGGETYRSSNCPSPFSTFFFFLRKQRVSF